MRVLRSHYFTDGQDKESGSGASHDVVDAATEEAIGQIVVCGATEIADVNDIANTAQKKRAAIGGSSRFELMREVAARVRKMAPMLGEMIAGEMGKLGEPK